MVVGIISDSEGLVIFTTIPEKRGDPSDSEHVVHVLRFLKTTSDEMPAVRLLMHCQLELLAVTLTLPVLLHNFDEYDYQLSDMRTGFDHRCPLE